MPVFSLLQITTTFPKDPQYTFVSTQRFPIENRDILGEIQVSRDPDRRSSVLKKSFVYKSLFVFLQNFHILATYLSQCTSTAFLDIVSDFHLLLFLVTNDVMPLRVSPLHLRCRKRDYSRIPAASGSCYQREDVFTHAVPHWLKAQW